MTGNGWLELRLRVPVTERDRAGDLLLELGATGFAEDHPGLHFDDGPVVEWHLPEAPNPTDHIELTGWYPTSLDPATLAARVAGQLGVAPTIRQVDDEDWNESWKRNWKAGRLSRRVIVVPGWEATPALEADERALRMDPGMAFGTGTHPTTQACAELLDQLLRSRGPDQTVADVGTGTGVLAIAALLLGARSALGVDTDPRAIEAATSNAHANGVAARFEAVVGSIGEVDRTCDIVIANLLAPLLISIAADLVCAVAPRGRLLISGILSDQGDEVVAAFEAAGARVVERIEDPAWVSFALERSEPSGQER